MCWRLLVSRSTSSATSATARAMAQPVLPVKMFPQSRTESIFSRVFPAVTSTRIGGDYTGSTDGISRHRHRRHEREAYRHARRQSPVVRPQPVLLAAEHGGTA